MRCCPIWRKAGRRYARDVDSLTGNSLMPTLFVTGTDTGVGKTRVACALLRAMRAQGLRVCAYKPVASGCEQTDAGLRNADALELQQAAETAEAYEHINPYAFEPPIAPHLAAAEAGVAIDLQRLDAVHADLAARYDWVIVEGAGGWQVPLSGEATFADWVARRQWPVLLVVGMRLGCINHALLSAESIRRRTLLAGWVANILPPRASHLPENIAALKSFMPVPLLGQVEENAPPQQVWSSLKSWLP